MDNAPENCYFWIDNTVPEEQRMMNVMCVECHDKNHPDLEAWFWEGIKGYGPYDFICDKCGKVIHKANR
jgi:hypothetical protein